MNLKSFKQIMQYLCIITVITSMFSLEVISRTFTFNASDVDPDNSYYSSGFAIEYDTLGGGQYFQLTDTTYDQLTAIWHSEFLNLREDLKKLYTEKKVTNNLK